MEEEESNNTLGLSNDDRENMKLVIDDLISMIVKFNGIDEPTENDYAHLKAVLDYGNFVVSGVIYSNGLELVCDHEDDDDDEDEDDCVE